MRILSIGQVTSAPDTWGFLVSADGDEELTKGSVFYVSPTHGEQAAEALVEFEAGVIGFFLQGYAAGDSLLINGHEVLAPAPNTIDPKLERHYRSPYAEGVRKHDWTWKCVKCGHDEYETSELRGSSDGLMAYMNWDDAIFRVVACKSCGYCEIYKR